MIGVDKVALRRRTCLHYLQLMLAANSDAACRQSVGTGGLLP